MNTNIYQLDIIQLKIYSYLTFLKKRIKQCGNQYCNLLNTMRNTYIRFVQNRKILKDYLHILITRLL